MALEDVAESMEGKGWLGLVLGAALLAPAIPAVARRLRPAAKGAVKGYLSMKDRAGAWLAETGEQWQDLVAEAKAEHENGPAEEMMTLDGGGAAITSDAAEEGSLGDEQASGSGGEKKRSNRKSNAAPQPA